MTLAVVPVRVKPNYPVVVGSRFFDRTAAEIARLSAGGRVFVFASKNLPKTLTQKFQAALSRRADVVWQTVRDGESLKTLKHVEDLLNHLAQNDADSSVLLVALGGGTLCDVVGLTAALYRRGVAWVALPTTLLAQVDASVGGKTAINLKFGKNQAGVFYQPRAVFADVIWQKSLNIRDFNSGMAEVVKTAIIGDAKLFQLIENKSSGQLQKNQKLLTEIVARCVRVKARIVSRDEHDLNLRQTLNLGHTIGHAVERAGHYKKWQHGEAVAIGLAFAARLAVHQKHCSAEFYDRILGVLKNYQLPTDLPKITRSVWQQSLQADKKRKADTLRFILPQKLGSVIRVPIALEEVLACLRKI